MGIYRDIYILRERERESAAETEIEREEQDLETARYTGRTEVFVGAIMFLKLLTPVLSNLFMFYLT